MRWDVIPVFIFKDCLVDRSIIDRSSKKSLKIKSKIISHLKIDVPTFSEKQLPQNLKSIPITRPGSRFIKWKD